MSMIVDADFFAGIWKKFGRESYFSTYTQDYNYLKKYYKKKLFHERIYNLKNYIFNYIYLSRTYLLKQINFLSEQKQNLNDFYLVSRISLCFRWKNF